jgi:hypothetical protein
MSTASSKASSPTTQCDILLPLSVYGNFFPAGHPVAAYLFLLIFPSLYPSLYLSFNNVFQKAVPTLDVTNPVSLPSIYCTYDIPPLPDSL